MSKRRMEKGIYMLQFRLFTIFYPMYFFIAKTIYAESDSMTDFSNSEDDYKPSDVNSECDSEFSDQPQTTRKAKRRKKSKQPKNVQASTIENISKTIGVQIWYIY